MESFITPVASLSCKESFTVSHYLNRFVTLHNILLQNFAVIKNDYPKIYLIYLSSPYLSNTVNKQVYGSCNDPNEHTHEYSVKVTMRGSVNSSIGTVMSLTDLRVNLRKAVTDKLNGKNLNADIDFFKTIVCTFH